MDDPFQVQVVSSAEVERENAILAFNNFRVPEPIPKETTIVDEAETRLSKYLES